MNHKDDYFQARVSMVEDQIVARGIVSKDTINAMMRVPRHEFVPDFRRAEAYGDHPVPIAANQTISQPYIVAYMTEALGLKVGDKVLEIGTGSGYQAAVLSEMGMEVHSIEIIESLGTDTRKLLKRLGYKVNVSVGDGNEGLREKSPFDGIIVTAAPPKIPPALVSQLKEMGRIVIPVGKSAQYLRVMQKRQDSLYLLDTLPVRFVPMTGKVSASHQ
jgi:protein-L-isoaspartate(D-aspartate) O-methyltransferase